MALILEMKLALRRLLKRPGHTLLSVTVLGVGLGLMMFLFATVNSLVIQPLPFPDAARLVSIGEPTTQIIGGMDSDQYLALEGKLHNVPDLGAYQSVGVNLDVGGGAVHYRGARMTGSLMTLLGVRPLSGRALAAHDDAPSSPAVVVLGEGVWRQAFHADPHAVGRKVRVNGDWATVVGVMPSGFNFPGGMQLWLPLHVVPGQHRDIGVAGRLAPTARQAAAQAELNAWSGRMARALPAGTRIPGLVVGPLAAGFVPTDMIRWVWLMFGAGVLVLLLACINVANLQWVRTLQRRHEMALRSALGSSRARLMLGALAESLWLGAAALALAFPITQACGDWIHVTWVGAHPEQQLFMRGIDGWVATFGVVAGLLCTLVACGLPAWRVSRVNLQDALRDGSKGSGGGFARAAKAMTVVEVMLTVVLLVGAGTFVRAIDRLLKQRTVGAAHAARVLTSHVALPAAPYSDDTQRIRFFEKVVRRLRSEPGVLDASAANAVPGARLGSHEDVALPGHPQPADGWPRAQMAIVDPHFLDTYGVQLQAGRFIDERDRADSLPVAVIDAKMAAAFWPHQDPLHRTLVLYPGKAYAETLSVIGVAEPLQLDSMLERSLPGLMIPLSQAAGASPLQSVGLAMRTRAGSIAPRLADAVHAVDPQAALFGQATQVREMARARLGLTILTDIFSALGMVALLLAGAGLYGVLAFSVAQRTREIGIRRAIGAGAGAIAVQVARQLFGQLGIGLSIGLLLAWPWSQLLADPGMHTRAHDPAVFLPVLVMVLAVALLATLVPLLRALRVDPAVALRYE